ncbi:MAG TPA: hypothetical protein VFN41_15690, partial [Candidatus Limnocylindrales bacterium]|nr:hypothetical protein [Candidatus Limnocylindrales bacterium]
MASTDAKSGFRLPWSADRNDSADPATENVDQTVDEAQPQGAVHETAATTEAASTNVADEQAHVGSSAASAPAVDATPTWDASAAGGANGAPSRKPNKFMADLTKAMQTAAEAARADVLEKFNAEAKAHIEGIHASTADEATQLRKRADDDVASIREWSKTEIAHIREETDERIAHRKEVLEREVEAHAAQIEARIEHVQARVTGFESEMAAFFERLLAEEDPTRFAAMAETLPEPPSFDDDDVATAEWTAPVQTSVEVEPAPQPADAWGTPEYEQAHSEAPVEAAEVAEANTWESTEATTETVEASTVNEAPAGEETVADTPVAEQWVAETPAESTVDAYGWSTESASGDTTTSDQLADAQPASEATAEPKQDSGDLFGLRAEEPVADPSQGDDPDPRLAALGLDSEFASAEAEAAAFTAEPTTDEQEIPTIADDALAARLAGLVADESPSGSAPETVSTRVVVTGLVSVASIAGFKRNLARVEGVRSVGVSSGPDGEFVFAVTHEPALDL